MFSRYKTVFNHWNVTKFPRVFSDHSPEKVGKQPWEYVWVPENATDSLFQTTEVVLGEHLLII